MAQPPVFINQQQQPGWLNSNDPIGDAYKSYQADLGNAKQQYMNAAGYQDPSTGQRVGGGFSYQHPILATGLSAIAGGLAGAMNGGGLGGGLSNALLYGAMSRQGVTNRRAAYAGAYDAYAKQAGDDYKNILLPTATTTADGQAAQSQADAALPTMRQAGQSAQDMILNLPQQPNGSYGVPPATGAPSTGLDYLGGTSPTSNNPVFDYMGGVPEQRPILAAGAQEQQAVPVDPRWQTQFQAPPRMSSKAAVAYMNNVQKMIQAGSDQGRQQMLIPSQVAQNQGAANLANAGAFENMQQGYNLQTERPYIAPMKKAEIADKNAGAYYKNQQGKYVRQNADARTLGAQASMVSARRPVSGPAPNEWSTMNNLYSPQELKSMLTDKNTAEQVGKLDTVQKSFFVDNGDGKLIPPTPDHPNYQGYANATNMLSGILARSGGGGKKQAAQSNTAKRDNLLKKYGL